jgi:hypothetical protein
VSIADTAAAKSAALELLRKPENQSGVSTVAARRGPGGAPRHDGWPDDTRTDDDGAVPRLPPNARQAPALVSEETGTYARATVASAAAITVPRNIMFLKIFIYVMTDSFLN